MDPKAKLPSSALREDEVARAMIADVFRKRNRRTNRAISNALQVWFVTGIVSDHVIEVSTSNPDDQESYRVAKYGSVSVEIGDAVLVGDVQGKNRAFLNLTRAAGSVIEYVSEDFNGQLSADTTEFFDTVSISESLSFILSDLADGNKLKKTNWGFVEQLMLSAANIGDAINGFTADTPADGDFITFADISASNDAKKITWADLKALLEDDFDSLPTSIGHYTNQVVGPATHGFGAIPAADLTVVADMAYAIPLIFRIPRTINRLTFEVMTAIAASTARVAVFTGGIPNTGASFTGTTLIDAGTVSTATTGIKNVDFSQATPVGPVILAIAFSHAIAVRAITSPMGFTMTTATGAPLNYGIKIPHVGAAAFAASEAFSLAGGAFPFLRARLA